MWVDARVCGIRLKEAQLAMAMAMNMTLYKVMAETIGMGLLPEEAARELAEEATYRHHILIWNFPRFDSPRVRQLVQDSQKFMYHGKRHRLVAEDVDQALRVTGQEPLYGFQASEHIPFRCCTRNTE